jgi:spore coat polysaccharide biosynthesis protein SpsF
MSRRVAGIVQARMSSQRLPGMVVASRPSTGGGHLTVLDWTVQRLRRAATVDVVVVATSDDHGDDLLATHCSQQGYSVFRGSLVDVLDRFHGAALAAGTDVVVRVTADCPLVDPAVVDRVVRAHLAHNRRFSANRLPPPYPRTYPVGLDVEVASLEDLHRAWSEAHEPHHREHVMPYLYEGHEDEVVMVEAETDAGDVRWTIDTADDLAAVRGLVTAADADLTTPWRRLLVTWRNHPELARINAHVHQRAAADVDPRRAP